MDCNFVQQGIKLPYSSSVASMPNFPRFRVDEEEVCDSTLTSIFGQEIFYRSDLRVFPNPTDGLVTIEIPEANSGTINIYNYNSELVATRIVKPGTITENLNLSGYSSGFYLIEYYPENNPNRKVFTSTVSLVK